MSQNFFDKVYDLTGSDEMLELYDEWAPSYDEELEQNAYATPERVAKALARYAEDLSAPVLDFGCGTGLSGVALREAGFTAIEGMDPSPDMLAQAEPKGVYDDLHRIEPDASAPIPEGQYPAIACAGAIGPGAAPPETVNKVMQALPPGGVVAMSLNDHAVAERVYEGALNQWIDCGAASLLMRKYGAHLPGQNIKAFVYVLEKK